MQTPDAAHHLAIVHDYDGLIEVYRERVANLGWTMDDVSIAAGLADGHPGKLLGQAQVKHLGALSFSRLLQGLGLAIVVVEYPAGLAESQAEIARKSTGRPRREKRQSEAPQRIGKMTLERVFGPAVKEMSRRGNEARVTKLAPSKRSRIAKRAARARWGKPKRWRRGKRVKTAEAVPAQSS